MITINKYISEKLHLNKDIKTNDGSVVDNMLEIVNTDEEKIKKIFTTWINDYSKKLYCYVSDIDYKYRYKDFKFDNISINKIDFIELKKAEGLADQSTVYKSKDENNKIEKINLSQNDLAVYFNAGWNPVIFEKSSI